MKILLFGATGMIGRGVLREALLDPDVDALLAIGRSATGETHPKLREIVREDLFDLTPIASELAGYDSCFYCLGVSSAGMQEADYVRVTYDLTIAVAELLARTSPDMSFIYVSGAGTDSSEKGSSMWARVKGETENALMKLPFKASYMFRPGFIQPMHGIKSKTRLYRAVYAVASPLYPAMKSLFPKFATNTEQVGRAMIEVARNGAPKQILENKDLNELSQRANS